LEEAAIKHGVTKQEWKNFIAYVGGFYGNMSNYHSFGAMKFIPELPSFEVFKKILYSHPKINEKNFVLQKYLD